MCGIAGEIRYDGSSVDSGRLREMAARIAHRGPEGEGVWHEGPVGLAHRRLALVDLSPTGAQPMLSSDDALVVTFNGEIYNYLELRKELEAQGVLFQSHSDTEVLLHLYARKGEKMLEGLHGMFAFAIWDRRTQRLFFARDRIGKKPFYYSFDGSVFQFASEPKALTEGSRDVDWEAVRLLVGLQYVPAPRTGWKGIRSLPPSSAGVIEKGILRTYAYETSTRTPKFSGSTEVAVKEVRRLLEDAVRYRLIADVPVGAFLSGGVDSSVIVALMSRLSSQPIQTFTMGFLSLGFDERAEARSLAKTFGTEHHEFEARPSDLIPLIQRIVDQYDVPFTDSSALPSLLLAEQTKPFVKAVLTGDGGDELFGGYRRYQAYKRALGSRAYALPLAYAAKAASLVTGDVRYARYAEALLALRQSPAYGYAELFTGSYFSDRPQAELLRPEFLAATSSATASQFITDHFLPGTDIEGALEFDLSSYLPDNLNVKVDRATMASGLEARSPFLDQDLVSFVRRLSISQIFQPGKIKPLLRQAFSDIVPIEVFDRPKRGFQVPLAEWFREQELKTFFTDHCLSDGSPLLSICRRDTVQRYLDENTRGKDHGNRLWMLLSLALWLKKQGASFSA